MLQIVTVVERTEDVKALWGYIDKMIRLLEHSRFISCVLAQGFDAFVYYNEVCLA
jgi:hypothetical protein